MFKKLVAINLCVIFIFVVSSACVKFNFLMSKSIKSHEATVNITEFSQMYNDILTNLMAPEHFMWQTQPGNFLGDWTGDAGAFSPHILFINGYTTEAKLVMDYVRTLQLSPASIKSRMFNFHLLYRNKSPTGNLTPYRTSNIVDFIIGFGSYYNGPTYYPEACDWCSAIGLGVTGGSIVVKSDPNPLGDVNGYIAGLASVTNTAFISANTCLNPNLLNTGVTLLNDMNTKYWNDTKGYYVDNNPNHQGNVEFSAFQNGSTLWALSWAYGIRKDPTVLDKISRLYSNAMVYLWDTSRGGLYDFKSITPVGKDLGSNLLWCRGLLWSYWVTGDIVFLDTAKDILTFIQNDLLIEDSTHPGFKIVAHDWYFERGASTNFCSGCNFLLLECIWLYNDLKTSGPLVGNIPVTTNPGCAKRIAN